MFDSRRVRDLEQSLAAKTAELETERRLHAEALRELRSERRHCEDMLVRVVDAALAQHTARSAELQPVTLVPHRPEPPEAPEDALPAQEARRRYAELHLGGLDERTALAQLASRERELIEAEERLAAANAADDGD